MSAPRRRARAVAGLAAIAAALGCAPGQRAVPRADGFSCSHVFLPMGAGVRRDYVVTARDPAVGAYRYTQTYAADGGAEPDAGSFAETMAFSNGARRVQRLRCEPGGGWRALSTAVDGVSDAGPGAAIAARGVTSLPAAEAWRVGVSWTDTGEISARDLPGLPPALVAGGGSSLTGTVTVASTIAASEPIAVPAGRFETYRIDASTAQRVVVDTGVLGKIPVELVTTTRTWYARGVGMVRQQAEPYGLTTELVAVTGLARSE